MLLSRIKKRIFFACAVSCWIAAMRCSATVTQNVTLAWDQDDDPHIPVIGYTLYYGTLSGIPYSNWVYIADVTNTTAIVSNLVEGTTYYFAVSAMGSNWVESALTPEMPYTVTSSIPAVTLEITNMLDQSAMLFWGQSTASNIVGYTVYYGTNISQLTNTIYLAGVTSTTTNVDGLVPGATNYFIVKAMDADGNESLPSNVAFYDVPTPAALPPFRITQISRFGLTSAWITWTNSDPNVASYLIYYGPDPNQPSGGYSVWDPTFTADYLDGFFGGATYYFTILSRDSDGNIITNTPQVAFTMPLPQAPVIQTPVNNTTESVTLTWKDDDFYVQHYTIFYDTRSDNPTRYGGYVTSDTTYTISGLDAGTTYYFIIKATDIIDEDSPFSNEVTNTVPFTITHIVPTPITLFIQLSNSPSGLPDPNNPVWAHLTSSDSLPDKWVLQDSTDLQNWFTFQNLSNQPVDVWVAPYQGVLPARYFRLYQTNW